jgi:hypothetical protein
LADRALKKPYPSLRRTKLAALRYHRCFAQALRRCASAGRHARYVRGTTLRANGRNPAGSRNCNSRCGFPGFAPTTPSLPELPHSYWVFVQRLLFISLLCVDYMRFPAVGQVRSGGTLILLRHEDAHVTQGFVAQALVERLAVVRGEQHALVAAELPSISQDVAHE